ncbi:MAG TPA: gamma-glutamyltransferase [Jiangellaceae bacterium]
MSHPKWSLAPVALTLVAGLIVGGASQPSGVAEAAAPPVGAVCEVPAGHPAADARGTQFMVAAAHPAAVKAGCEVMARGGSAADAAVAVQMVLAVVEPEASGLAGGTLITYWDADHRDVQFYEGLATAPSTVTENLRDPTEAERDELGINRFPTQVSATGRAFGVPGTVRVLADFHEDHGIVPWGGLFDDAITLANDGFPMPPYMNDVLGATASGRPRCAYPDLNARYCDGDQPKPVGTMLFNPELGEVLEEVRDGGADAFYDPEGTIAPAIVERATEGPFKLVGDEEGPVAIPSLVTVDDFADYEAHKRDPVCAEALRLVVCSSAPPAFGGVTVLYMLGLLERGSVAMTRPDSLERYHLSIEASRLANFDRREYVGDPDFHPVPVDGLLDPGYLDERFSLFSPDSAIHPVEPGLPPGVEAAVAPAGATADIEGADETSHVSIVDADGNAVAMTTTVNTTFGAQMEAQGMILNNVQTNFTELTSISPGKPVNVMEPRKRARTSMAPTIVLNGTGQELRLVVGAAGGGPIPDFVTQTLVGTMVDRLGPSAAIRQDHYSGQQITSNCSGVIGPPSELEAGTAAALLLDGLNALEHPCARTVTLRSGLTAIEVRGRGLLLGAADPRRDGIALGR